MTTNIYEDDSFLQKAEETIQNNLDIIYSCGYYTGIKDTKQKVRDAIDKCEEYFKTFNNRKIKAINSEKLRKELGL